MALDDLGHLPRAVLEPLDVLARVADEPHRDGRSEAMNDETGTRGRPSVPAFVGREISR
ncbi:MAG TPA: hypothetical protein VHV76_10440 [Mycobacteriales bacterium]|jgi:hypothetical protein|nr:hypothetical protein [Mycobacteriales bacterium]